MRVQDLCKAAIDWLVEAGVLDVYEESGKFVEPLGGKGKFALDRDQRLLTHYAVCSGSLYTDERRWRRAYQMIHMFTAAGLAQRNRRTWKLASPFGPLEAIPPAEALVQLQSAFVRAGFQMTDQNDATGSAVFRTEDTGRVIDLPEPYGKWFQHRERRPRWDEPLDLAIEVHCRVLSRVQSPGPHATSAYATVIDIELSGLAPSLVLDLQSHLARSPRLRHLDAGRAKRELSRNLAASARSWLASV